MKVKSDLKKLIGLTQDEIATYLNITRAQWSMFASRKRDLPLEASVKLALLFQHLHQSEATQKLSDLEKVTAQTKNSLLMRIKKLEIYQKINEDKRQVFEKKRQELQAALNTLDYLRNQKDCFDELLNTIENRINTELRIYSQTNLLLLNERIHLLELEHKSLTSLVKQIQKKE